MCVGKNYVGSQISPHSTIFSPRTMKIPRGISPNCLLTCIRSIVSCNIKLAVESIKSNFPRILITCDSHQTGQHCGDIQSGFVHLVRTTSKRSEEGSRGRKHVQVLHTMKSHCPLLTITVQILGIYSHSRGSIIPVKHEHAVDGIWCSALIRYTFLFF